MQVLNKHYFMSRSRPYKKQRLRKDQYSNNSVRKHKARAMEVRKRKAARPGVQQCDVTHSPFALSSEGTPVRLARCFYGMAGRRDHDPGSFLGERKVEESSAPLPPSISQASIHPVGS